MGILIRECIVIDELFSKGWIRHIFIGCNRNGMEVVVFIFVR